MRVAVPGPITLLMPLRRGGPYASEDALIADLIEIVRAEVRALVAAGCEFVQIDEPNYVMAAGKHRAVKGEAGPMVEALNASLEGVRVKTALHVCFGNAHNNSFASPRRYRALYPRLLDAHVSQFVFEYANREMSEIELWGEFPSDKEVAVGVVDVKAFRVETPEEIVDRARLALSLPRRPSASGSSPTAGCGKRRAGSGSPSFAPWSRLPACCGASSGAA